MSKEFMLEGKSDWRKKKRSKEGGSIRRNADGTFTARVQYRDEFGNRKEATKKTRNISEARQAIRKMRQTLEEQGRNALKGAKLSFAEVANRFEKVKLCPAVYQNGKRVAGLKSLAPRVSALKPLMKYFGKRNINEIRTSDIEAYKNQRLATPVEKEIKVKVENKNGGRKKFLVEKIVVRSERKIASVNRELSLLRQIFRFAKSDRLINFSPFEDQSLICVSAETVRDRILTRDEEVKLLVACSGPRAHLKPLVICALDTAMRHGELLKLRWENIDFEANCITLLATNTKTEQSRIVPISDRLKNELLCLKDNSPIDPAARVFGIKNTFKHAWKTACRLAEIDGLNFHDLRHTATTRLVRVGVQMPEAMKITGHSQLKTFQRYVNLSDEGISNAKSRLDTYHQGNGF